MQSYLDTLLRYVLSVTFCGAVVFYRMEKRTVFKAEGGKRCPKHTAGMSLRSNIIGCGIWRGRELPLFFCCCFFCCRFFLGKGAHPPHFCRIININFLLFFHGNSLGQKFTILESSGKRRLVCLKHETTYVAGWIWDISFFFYSHSLPPPPPPPMEGYRR